MMQVHETFVIYAHKYLGNSRDGTPPNKLRQKIHGDVTDRRVLGCASAAIETVVSVILLKASPW
jgi:hypothetical protein